MATDFARAHWVRAVAAIPAIGLIAGSALGFLLSDPPVPPGPIGSALHYGLALTIVLAIVACWARRASKVPALATAVGCGFLVGGAMLSAAAWHEAWRPTLRAAFEELARRERAHAALDGRRLPEDDEAFAVVEGVLRSDAALTASGVSVSLDVESIEVAEADAAAEKPTADAPSEKRAPAAGSADRRAHLTDESRADPIESARPPPRRSIGLRRWLAVSGGVQATVVGSLAPDRSGEWRAGRRVRVPLQLHRPSRYLDVGVPDSERALARRGTTLVATVKSGALVDVRARAGPVDEGAAAVRAYARRAIA